MKKKEKTTWLQTAGILLFAAACTMALYSLYLCFGSDIWYDELFTEGFISQPVGAHDFPCGEGCASAALLSSGKNSGGFLPLFCAFRECGDYKQGRVGTALSGAAGIFPCLLTQTVWLAVHRAIFLLYLCHAADGQLYYGSENVRFRVVFYHGSFLSCGGRSWKTAGKGTGSH